ncbi:MAG: maleylpyruvate isomerase family mycothiol-dependent enzyme [Nocardioides sp.]
MSIDTDAVPDGSDLPHFEETILATTRYLADIEGLTDDQVREPSALPGWTRAHVITHLSRNADALSAVLHAAQEGRQVAMYPDQESRDAEIEAGASRSAAEIIEDAAASWGRMLQAENELHDSHLDVTFTRRSGTEPLSVRHVGHIRRTEVEIHHADLLLGYTPADWPHDFSRDLISRRQQELADGLSMVLSSTDVDGLWKFGPGHGPEISGAVGDLAWWLVGRGDGSALVSSTGELPQLPRWR